MASFQSIATATTTPALEEGVESPQDSTFQYVISVISDAVACVFLWIAAFFADYFCGAGETPRLPSASPLPPSTPPQPSPRGHDDSNEASDVAQSIIIRPSPRRPSSGGQSGKSDFLPKDIIQRVVLPFSTPQDLSQVMGVSRSFHAAVRGALTDQYTQVASVAGKLQVGENKSHFTIETAVPTRVTVLALESLTHQTLMLLQGVSADKLSKTDSSTLKSLQQRQKAEGRVVELAWSHSVVPYYCTICPKEELDNGEGHKEAVEKLCPHSGLKLISSVQSKEGGGGDVAIEERLVPLHAFAGLREGVPCRRTIGESQVWARADQLKWHGFLPGTTAPGTFPEAGQYLLSTAEPS